MPYYGAGDYYRGDARNYAAGGLFDVIGKVAKGVSGAIGGFVTGGPLGAIKGAIGAVKPMAQPIPFQPMNLAPIPVTPVPGIGGAISRLLPGGDTGYEVVPSIGGGRRPGDTGRVGHFKKDGTWTNRARPRMNVTNVRALRKAGRRVRGFLKVAARLGALPVSRSGKGKLFRRKKR
jgi:hypothetical protein